MHDSKACPICRGLPVEGTMSDEEFARFLDACRQEMEKKQPLFWKRVQSAERWWCELGEGTLAFDDCKFPITVVGTHSGERQTWLWGWANESFPESARDASRRLQSLFKRTGFRVFVDPGMPASSDDAQDLVAFAIHELDGIGFYRCPSDDGPTLCVVVHEPPTGAAE